MTTDRAILSNTHLSRKAFAISALLLLSTSTAAIYSAAIRSDLGFSLLLLSASALVCSVIAAYFLCIGPITTGGIHFLGIWLMVAYAPLREVSAGNFENHYGSYQFFALLPTEVELSLSALGVLIWVFASACGYLLTRNRLALRLNLFNIDLHSVAVFLQVALAVLALLYIYSQVGFGVLTRAGLEAFAYESPGELTFFASTVRTVPIVALLALLIFLRDPSTTSAIRYAGMISALGVFIGTLAINNPIAAPRFYTATVLIALSYVLIFHRQRDGLVFLAMFLAGVFVLFPALDVGRTASDFGDAFAEIPIILQASLSGDTFRTFESIPAALRFIDERGIEFGYQLLGPLLFWIPRALWPEKPLGTGALLVQELGGPHDNVACAPMCEALVNFGWVGIPLIGFLFGACLRVVDDIHRTASLHVPTRLSVALVAYPLLLGQVFFLTRGDFLSPWSFTVGMMLATIPLVVAEYLYRRGKAFLFLALTKKPHVDSQASTTP